MMKTKIKCFLSHPIIWIRLHFVLSHPHVWISFKDNKNLPTHLFSLILELHRSLPKLQFECNKCVLLITWSNFYYIHSESYRTGFKAFLYLFTSNFYTNNLWHLTSPHTESSGTDSVEHEQMGVAKTKVAPPTDQTGNCNKMKG